MPESLARDVATAVNRLRGFDIAKRPGVAETIDWAHALMLLGVPLNRVLRRIRETREQRYGLFRGFYRGITDEVDESDEREQLRLHSVRLPQGAATLGRTLKELDLARLRVEVTALRELAPVVIEPIEIAPLVNGEKLE